MKIGTKWNRRLEAHRKLSKLIAEEAKKRATKLSGFLFDRYKNRLPRNSEPDKVIFDEEGDIEIRWTDYDRGTMVRLTEADLRFDLSARALIQTHMDLAHAEGLAMEEGRVELARIRLAAKEARERAEYERLHKKFGV